MALEVDGASILMAIGRNPAAFGMNATQVNEVALATLLSRLKDKAFILSQARSLAEAISADDLAYCIDNLKSRELAAFAKRLDPKNTALKQADDQTFRSHLIALMMGKTTPAEAAAKAPRARSSAPRTPAATTGSKTGKAMQSTAVRARRKT